jgi:hypothetical protein
MTRCRIGVAALFVVFVAAAWPTAAAAKTITVNTTKDAAPSPAPAQGTVPAR